MCDYERNDKRDVQQTINARREKRGIISFISRYNKDSPTHVQLLGALVRLVVWLDVVEEDDDDARDDVVVFHPRCSAASSANQGSSFQDNKSLLLSQIPGVVGVPCRW